MWAIKTNDGDATYWLTVEAFPGHQPYLAWGPDRSERMLVEDREVALKWLRASPWDTKKVLVRVCGQ